MSNIAEDHLRAAQRERLAEIMRRFVRSNDAPLTDDQFIRAVFSMIARRLFSIKMNGRGIDMKLVGLPSSVRIGPHDVEIKVRPGGAECNFGTWDEDRMLIRVDPSFHSPSRAAEVVLHEIHHAIEDIYGVQQGDDVERRTTVMARGWTQVWRDNPQLLGWIALTLRKNGER